MLILIPLLRHVSIRTRVITGLPLLVAGTALILASGSLAALFTPGAAMDLTGLILVVSALLRWPHPGRPAAAEVRAS
jgi:hypothetical protein